MVQKRETKAINKLCAREIISLSFVYGAYFFEFRGRNLVCFGIAYNFDNKFAPEAGKARMRTAFFTRVIRAWVSTSFPGSLFSAFLGWKKDPGCGWSRYHPESG